MKLSEFEIHPQGRCLTCLLAEPEPGRLAADPAIVLNFASDRRTSMTVDPYDIAVRTFVEAGHRALSFDLPHHGERVGPWKTPEIAGFAEAITAGIDPFKTFIADGMAAIDAILARGLAKPGRIFLDGTSRAGYCSLRLAAADPRVAGVAANAPVTDWRVLTEFQPLRDRPDVAAMDLIQFAQHLAGRPVYMAISNCDGRVDSELCARLAMRLLELEAAQKLERSHLVFHVVDTDIGHRLADTWRRAGAEFLLRQLASA